MYQIGLSPSADREFKRLPKAIQATIASLFDGPFCEDPFSRSLPIKKLKTPFPGHRIRSGDYRILYTVEESCIRIYSIKHRKDAYR